MVEDDLRIPLLPQLTGHRAGFRLLHHEPVAIVVVAGVLMVKNRQLDGLERGADVPSIPLGHHLEAVRVHDRHQQKDYLLADATDLRFLAGDHPVGEGRGELRSGHLRSVQPAVDPHDDPALLGEDAGLHSARSAGRQPPGDLPVAVQRQHVGLTGDDREKQRPALR